MLARNLTAVILLALAVSLTACGHDTVPSGSYTGEIVEVNPGEKEIYVELSDGKVLELYFTETTKLTAGDDLAEFDALKVGQTVTVQVENADGELNPLAVKIAQD